MEVVMKILVDAACPVKDKLVATNNIPVYMFIDTSHILPDYSKVIVVVSSDAVDLHFLIILVRGYS